MESGKGEQGAERRCSLYVFTCTTGREILAKVGYAYNPKKRLKEVQTGCPLPICGVYAAELASRANAQAAELRAHMALNGFRTCGEWFKVPSAGLEALFAGIETALDGAELTRHPWGKKPL